MRRGSTGSDTSQIRKDEFMRQREKREYRMSRNRSVGLRASVFALSLALLLALVPTVAFADGPPTISVGSSGEVAPGAEFTVPVSIEGNSGFAACALSFSYDKDALELVRVSEDGLLQGGQMNNIAGDSVGYFTMNNMDSDGVLFSATFRVKDTAVGGTYEVQIGLREGLENNLVDASSQPISASFTAGSVQVVGEGVPSGGGGTPSGDGTPSDAPSGTEPDAGQGEQGGGSPVVSPPPTGNTQVIAGNTQVTAVGADGSELQFLVRSTNNTREYSLDDGATWEAVPEDGIITTNDGKTISIDGREGADFTVKELPAGLAASTSEEGGVPIAVWLGVAAVIVAGVVVAFLVIKRRRDTAREMASRARRLKEHGTRGRRANKMQYQASDIREAGEKAVRGARHMKEE
jgi:hypothetical protein